MVSRRYELTDSQWDSIKQYFEVPKKNGRPYKNVRNTFNGIVWILKNEARSAIVGEFEKFGEEFRFKLFGSSRVGVTVLLAGASPTKTQFFVSIS